MLRGATPRKLPQEFTISSGNQYQFTMSSNVVQSAGIGGLVNSVDASSDQVGAAAWNAFDSVNTTGVNGWFAATSSVTSWLRVTLNYAIVVRRYAIVAQTDYPSYAPKTWTFEGSNDGTNWTVLDTRSAQPNWATNEKRSYTFSNGIAYTQYRIQITLVENVVSGNGCACIGELEIYD